MKNNAKRNILANTKILNDKTYQDFNKEAPYPIDPMQTESTELAERVEKTTEIDVNAIPHVGARDKNANH